MYTLCREAKSYTSKSLLKTQKHQQAGKMRSIFCIFSNCTANCWAYSAATVFKSLVPLMF